MNANQRIMLRIAASIFAGACLGGLIGAKLNSVSLWFGIPCGGAFAGVIAGVCFAFEKIMYWAPIAWKQTWAKVRGWDWPSWREIGSFVHGSLVFIILLWTGFTYCGIAASMIEIFFPEKFLRFCDPLNPFFYAGCFVLATVLGVVFVAGDRKAGFKLADDKVRARNNKLIFLGNPIVAPFVVLFYVLQPFVLFFGLLARYVYSDEVALVIVCAAAGGAVGAWFGDVWSIVLAAAVSSLLGVLQYELISKRWLKLVPAS